MKQYPGKRILIEGWRDVPNSYSLANQFQCLELLRRPEIEVRHRDMPYCAAHWKPVSGLMDARREQAVRGIPAPRPGEHFDAVLRMDFPLRVRPASVRTCVFMTCELGLIEAKSVAMGQSLAQPGPGDVVYVTPSFWSRRGVVNSGADPARVVVIPLGVDPEIFHPLTADARAAVRQRRGFTGFTFAHFGAMTPNKNMCLLLKAFAEVALRHPESRLLLKGLESLYFSRKWVEQSGALLTGPELARVVPLITYTGETFSYDLMAELYQAADAYVAPYTAEGFNLPVLEAAACGVPVICTAGGPTDDFTTPDFALRVESQERACNLADGRQGNVVQPSLESLISHMLAVIEKPQIGERARVAGPQFVANGFLWSQVVDRLLAVMLD